MLILFWIAVGLVAYTYFGFPVLLAIRAVFSKSNSETSAEFDSLPHISIITAAYNEEQIIFKKLENIFALNYPTSRLEVIIASDGSTDRTVQIVSEYQRFVVHLLDLPRQGKNRTLNAAVSASSGEILVFTDADTLLEPDALMKLVAHFNDATVGAVAGDYRYDHGKENANEEKTYWNYDRILKRLQSRSGSVTSATGQIYAIRRSLFQPIPEKLVDDFYVSVQAPAAHRRLLFEPAAIARGSLAQTSEEEFERKVRVITGGLRTVWRVKFLLNPFEYGFYAVQLFTHKLLRRLLVLPLSVLAISSLFLWHFGMFYQMAAASQILFHAAAGFGFLLRRTSLGRFKLLSLPFFFDLVNYASLVALLNLLAGARHDIWTPRQRPYLQSS